MTTLIFTGSLFSDLDHTLEKYGVVDNIYHPMRSELSELCAEICKQRYPNTDPLAQVPFSPNDAHLEKARRHFCSVGEEQVVAWKDNNTCLMLDFWQAAASDAKFVLLYTSPEHELANCIEKNEYDVSPIEDVIEAWAIRTRAMLNFFMNNREYSVLVNINWVGTTNGQLTDVLNKHFDLDLDNATTTAANSPDRSALLQYLATTLLLENESVSELYDEVRSAATVVSGFDQTIPDIEERSTSLVSAFLDEVSAFKQLTELQQESRDELSLKQLQLDQLAEALEHYFQKSHEQVQHVSAMVTYLGNDPLLNIARQARPR